MTIFNLTEEGINELKKRQKRVTTSIWITIITFIASISFFTYFEWIRQDNLVWFVVLITTYYTVEVIRITKSIVAVNQFAFRVEVLDGRLRLTTLKKIFIEKIALHFGESSQDFSLNHLKLKKDFDRNHGEIYHLGDGKNKIIILLKFFNLSESLVNQFHNSIK